MRSRTVQSAIVLTLILAAAIGGVANAQPAPGQEIYPGMMGPGMMGQGMGGPGMTAPGTAGPGSMLPGTAAGASGARLFAEACAGCHALQPGARGIGPDLHGLFGRRAGSLPGYPYSPAMRRSGTVWTGRSLDRFLAAPQRMVPGTTMRFPGIADARLRASLVAWLARATR